MAVSRMQLAVLSVVILSAGVQVAEASWRSLAGSWTDKGNGWEGTLPQGGDEIWHYGPARLWSIPVNAGSYVITSRSYAPSGSACGHVFKYKKGSVRSRSLVTKAWGYFLYGNRYAYISSTGAESSPRFDFGFSTGTWYTLKSVVDGTNVKIYIDGQLVKEVEMQGAGADSATDNYVGLWCHARTRTKGDSFRVTLASCPRLSLPNNVTVSPGNCSDVNSPIGAVCSFSCARGYRLIGQQSTTCSPDGSWSKESSDSNCVDVDECLTDNAGCSHSCTNVPGGYRCSCPDPELTLGADNHTCKAEGVTVNCAKDHMSITLPKALVGGFDRLHLRLLNTSCQATATATHYTLETPLTGCGTTSRHTTEAVVYSNMVVEMPFLENDVITRVREVGVPFHCYYGNDRVVSAVSFKASNRKLIFSENGQGNFSILLDMFPDERFVAAYSNRDFPVGVVLRQRLYFQVSVESADQQLSIIADKCFATPTQDSSGQPQHEFIGGGCSKDDTLQFHSESSSHRQRFSLEAFKFIADHPFVFIHCHVKICNATDHACARKCSSRDRRAADHARQDGRPLYSLSEGPFLLKSEETGVEASNSRASSGVSLSVVLLAELAGIGLAGMLVMMIRRKMAAKPAGYTLLPHQS